MPEAAYSRHAVHGWRRGMFRRGTDYSWPLILVFAGLFFLSLRLPRHWERIARSTPLVLTPHKSQPAKELATAVVARKDIPHPEVFHSIQPADYIASNSDFT